MRMSKEREVPDRRRFKRVFCKVPGAVGEVGIMIVDMSQGGIGVVHVAPLPEPGEVCRVEVSSEVGPIRLDCAIVRTVKASAVNAARELFQSGLQVIATDRQSEARLRTITEK